MDMTGNYGSAFYSCAAGMSLSALFLGLVRPAKRGLLCRRRSLINTEDVHVREEACKQKSEEQNLDNRTESPNNCPDSDDTNQTGDVQEIIRFA